MVDISLLKNSKDPSYIVDNILYNVKFRKEHPHYFYADGLTIFVGSQGSGKTLSAVQYVQKLLKKYPKAILVSNIELSNYPFDDERIFPFNNAEDLQNYSNGEYGVIYLIDEIQLYFNSLESKNINPETMTQFAQQRKQRKHIVATSQVFGRMAKPLREQFSSVILCNNYFKIFQINKLIDRDSLSEDNSTDTNIQGKVKHRFFWIHSPNYYKSYNTYYVIDRNKFVTDTLKGANIYDFRLSDTN